MKLLLSNDDGVMAAGIDFLNVELMQEFDTTVIAPDQERSSCGHGITLGDPIRVKEIKKDIYQCSGYPADCILVGIGNILLENKPDLVVSGINHGANLGQDRYYSGTIAAAREAAFRGVPSIAVSLATKNLKDIQHFETAAKFVRKIISKGILKHIPQDCLININVPNLPEGKIVGVKLASSGFQQYSEEVIERTDARGRNYYWVGGTYQGSKDIPGSDCNIVNEGHISVELQNLTGDGIKDLSSLEEFLNDL